MLVFIVAQLAKVIIFAIATFISKTNNIFLAFFAKNFVLISFWLRDLKFLGNKNFLFLFGYLTFAYIIVCWG